MESNQKRKTLRDLRVGDTAKINCIHGTGPLKTHIMNMGITKGCEVYIRKLAPLGDPVEVTIRGYELTLRKSECELIEVE